MNNTPTNLKTKIAELFSTVFYVGKIKYSPGTFGSLVAFPLCYFIIYLTAQTGIVFNINPLSLIEQQLATIILIGSFFTILIFMIGTYFTSIYIRAFYIHDFEQKDPKEVVIDEVVGQMLVIILTLPSFLFVLNSKFLEYISISWLGFVLIFLLPFILFRIFDILKPWPINWCDKNIKGTMGIMLDDIASALFAVVVHYIIVFLIA